MCFTSSFMIAIKSHSSPEQVGVLPASPTLRRHKVILSTNGVPQSQHRGRSKTLNVHDTVVQFLTNQALVLMNMNGLLGNKDGFLFLNCKSQNEFRRWSTEGKWKANMTRTERLEQWFPNLHTHLTEQGILWTDSEVDWEMLCYVVQLRACKQSQLVQEGILYSS